MPQPQQFFPRDRQFWLFHVVYYWIERGHVSAQQRKPGVRVSETMCKEVSVSLPLRGDSHDSGEIDEATRHRDVGDVRRPDLIGSIYAQAA